MQTTKQFLILLGIIASTSAIDIMKLDNSPGIYFNFIGSAEIYQSHWTLLVHYNLSNYFYELDTLSTCIHQIELLCSRLKTIEANVDDCQIMHNQLLLQLEEINNTQETMLHSSRRIKRSLIDGGGAILNFLIGTLDQNYAKTNDDNLLQLNQKQEFLSTLLKNHTSILENTVALIRKERNDIDDQVVLFNKHLSQIDFNRNHDLLKNDLNQHLAFLSTYTTLTLSRFRLSQISIINLLANTNNYAASIQSLMPATMHAQLEYIEQHLPSNVHLPKLQNKLDVSLIYKVSEISSTLVSQQLFCEFQIPLILNIDFQLFKALSVPAKGTDGYMYIQPEKENLLISYDRSHITYLSPSEFDKCHKTSTQAFICKNLNPIFNPSTDRFSCERQLLNHASSVPKTCVLKRTIPGQYWIQVSPNKYLFVMNTPQTVEQICSHNVSYSRIENTGIIAIPPKCQLRTEEITINSETSETVTEELSYVPSFNVTNFVETDKIPLENTPFLSKLGDHNKLDELTRSITTLKQAQDDEPSVQLHFQRHHPYYVFGSLLLLVFVLYCCDRYHVVSKIRQRICKTNTENSYDVVHAEVAFDAHSSNNTVSPIPTNNPLPSIPPRNVVA